MKLSEAMRKGSKMARQTFQCWSDGHGGGCALVLTSIGSGIISRPEMALEFKHGYIPIPTELMGMFPELLQTVDKPCECKSAGNTLWQTIMHLNDWHKYTAERIAGWIEAHVEAPSYSALNVRLYMEDPEKEARYV